MPDRKVSFIPKDIADSLEGTINDILDSIPKAVPEPVAQVLFKAKQDSLGKAILSDLLDIVPIAGDISNMFRLRSAALEGQETLRKRRFTKQALDLVLGMAPEPFGAIADFFTPTNMITYLQETKLKGGKPW